jgi:hypothetical protein
MITENQGVITIMPDTIPGSMSMQLAGEFGCWTAARVSTFSGLAQRERNSRMFICLEDEQNESEHGTAGSG